MPHASFATDMSTTNAHHTPTVARIASAGTTRIHPQAAIARAIHAAPVSAPRCAVIVAASARGGAGVGGVGRLSARFAPTLERASAALASVTRLATNARSSGTSRRRAVAASAALQASAPGETVLGFIGMGILGVPMTLNLIKAGYKVVVYNRSPEKCGPAADAGATVAASAREVVEKASYTFATLSDPEAALAVAHGPDGVAAGMAPGKGYIDVSTVDAETSAAVGALVRAAGGTFLEAPVSGSKGPAEQGTLIFLTAGDEELYKAVEGPLDVMGKAKFFLGEVGAGAKMKLVVNMVMGSMMVAFAEGLSLAERSGLNQKDLVEVVGLGAIAAPMYALKGPTMIDGKYAPAFPLKHQQKDMRLALALGDQVAQQLPVAAASNAAYVASRAQGLGESDFSAVIEAIASAKKK